MEEPENERFNNTSIQHWIWHHELLEISWYPPHRQTDAPPHRSHLGSPTPPHAFWSLLSGFIYVI